MPNVRIDDLEIAYSVACRSIRYPRLEFKTGKLLVVLPKGRRSAKEVIEKHKRWIAEKRTAINVALLKSKDKHLNLKRSNKSLRKMTLTLMKKFSDAYGFHAEGAYFRKMNSKWASYSGKHNLTINTDMKYLPKNIIEYVIFHEMVHSFERKHNARFWKVVEKRFRNHQLMEKELMEYWFSIRNSRDSGEAIS